MRLLLTILLSILVLPYFQVDPAKASLTQESSDTVTEIDKLKLAAFTVLKTKCNTCHLTQNPNRVFTLNNMNTLARKINRQVFIFKRMPKGKVQRKQMTEEELQALKTWINAVTKK